MGRVPRPLRRPQDRARHLRTRLRHRLPARTRLRPLPDDAPRPRPTIPARRDHRKPERTPRRSPRTRLARRRPRTHHQHRRSRAEAHPDAPHRNQPRPPGNAASDHHAHLNAMNTHRRTLHPAWCRKELAHVLLHGRGDFPAGGTAGCRGSREVEAESVAYLIAADAGLDTADYTFAYVAGWAADTGDVDATLRVSAARVLATAHQFLATTAAELAAPEPADADQLAAATADLAARAGGQVRGGGGQLVGVGGLRRSQLGGGGLVEHLVRGRQHPGGAGPQ